MHPSLASSTLSSLLAILAAAPALAAVPATDWYIDDDATGPGTGSLTDPFPTIQAALDAPTTLAGDRLLVETGTYSDPFVIEGLSVDIVAAPGAGTVELLRTDLSQVLVTIRNVAAPGVFLEGLEIASVSPMTGSGRLIEVVSAHVAMHQCSVLRTGTGNDSGAMKSSAGSNVTMTDCLISENDGGEFSCGLSFFDSSAAIHSCDFVDNPNSTFGFGFQGGAIYFTGGAQDVLTVSESLFTGNNGFDGSGVKIGGQASGAFTACDFIENGDAFNNQFGGALSGRGSIDSCVFRRNSARDGGAVYGEWSIADSLFELNTGADGADYATAVQGFGNTTLTGCIVRNHAGASMNPQRSSSAVLNATLIGCLLENNWSFMIDPFVRHGGGAITDCVAIDCTFIGNRVRQSSTVSPNFARGGAAVDSTLTRCILIDNFAREGGGVYRCDLQNCTLIGNAADLAGAALDSNLNSCIVFESGLSPISGGSVVYSDVEGGTVGLGNIGASPLFWGPASRDLRLTAASPCIDMGDPSLTDPDGSRIDMGALPFDPNYQGTPASFCPTGADGAGCSPELLAAAAPSISNGLALRATGMRDASLSLVFLSLEPNNTPYLNGSLCLGGTLRRGPIGTLNPGTGPCGNSVDFAITGASLAGAGFQPGDLFYAQAVYRDVIAGVAGISITGAIEARVEP